MSTFVLKLIAIITMLIDHTGAVFISPEKNPWLYLLFRGVGRLAFPIFVFLIVEGFYHTKNVKKYLLRMGIFAFISEIPFDLAFYHERFHVNTLNDIGNALTDPSDSLGLVMLRLNSYQNVFFTLFLGLLLITLMDMVEKRFSKPTLYNIFSSNIMDALLTVGFCAAAYFLKTDYAVAGILMFVAYYLFRGRNILITVSTFIITGTLLSDFTKFGQTGNILFIISTFATFAILPIAFYNGKKGKNVKFLFYIFYPAHLLALFIIQCFL
jgi:hypothetical protein